MLEEDGQTQNSGTFSCDMSGTIAVVIGASTGLGQAISVALASSGSRVIGASRDLSRLEGTIDRVTAAGGEFYGHTVDVTSPESVQELAETVVSTHGIPTVLVNSAGVMIAKNAFDITAEDWDLVHTTHLRAPFLASQAFGRGMAQIGYGKIINFSSTWAYTFGFGRTAYCAAKAGVNHLTTSLACEWGPLGIRVNAIAPVATKTPASELRMAAEPDRESWLVSRIPLGRLAEPADIVGTALFLASKASDFITGETIIVDGGWRASK